VTADLRFAWRADSATRDVADSLLGPFPGRHTPGPRLPGASRSGPPSCSSAL